ncbi:MAG: MFS transporter [Acetobacteraceae bacterium]|nr:MFS transporter [Acetobacteraceae bacterium]
MRIIAPLSSAPVALLWGGLSLSAIGDQLYLVALNWIAVGVFGAAAGYLNALGASCLLATALFVGRWADRWEQRRAMIGADLVRAAVLLLLVLGWEATGAPSAPGLVLVVAALGAGQAVFRPAMQALLPALVEARTLPAANALFDTTERIARLLGPGLVGLLAGLLPTRHFLTADALSFLLSAAVLGLLARVRALPALRRGGAREGVLAGIARGFRTVARHELLRFVLGVTGVLNGAWFAALFLGLPLAIARYGVAGPGGTGLGAYGLVISAYGCTNLMATFVVGSREMPARPGRQIFAGNMLMGAGVALLGLALGLPHGLVLPGLCAAAAVAAPGGPMQDIPVAVLRQTELPRAEVPAAMRAFLVASNLGTLLAMALAPALFSLLAVPAGIALCGGATMAVGATGLVRCGHLRAAPPSLA